MKLLLKVFGFSLLCAAVYSCGGTSTDETTTRGDIKIAVEEAFRLVMQSEVETFHSVYKYAIIRPEYKSEGECIRDLVNDSVRLAVISRELTAKERKIFEQQKIIPRITKIAYDGLAFIVNKTSTDSQLTFNQVRDIFTGKAPTWNAINGSSGTDSIRVVFDHGASGTARYLKDTFQVRALPPYCFAASSNEDVIKYVETHPGSLGVLGVNWISDRQDSVSHNFLERVRVVEIQGKDGEFIKPHQGYIATRNYPFVRPVYMISREAFTGLGTGFVSFVAGDKGQRIILRSKLVPASMPVRLVEVNNDAF